MAARPRTARARRPSTPTMTSRRGSRSAMTPPSRRNSRDAAMATVNTRSPTVLTLCPAHSSRTSGVPAAKPPVSPAAAQRSAPLRRSALRHPDAGGPDPAVPIPAVLVLAGGVGSWRSSPAGRGAQLPGVLVACPGASDRPAFLARHRRQLSTSSTSALIGCSRLTASNCSRWVTDAVTFAWLTPVPGTNRVGSRRVCPAPARTHGCACRCRTSSGR